MLARGYRHIVWDWNGTLLDDLDLSLTVMNDLLRRRGLPSLDRRRYHDVFDFPVRDYYLRLGFAAGDFDRLSVEFIAGYDRQRWDCRLHAGAVDVLAAVTAAGLTQSILSAYRQETLREIVGHFGLAAYFLRLNGLDNIHAHSKLELGRAWLRDLGLPAAEVLLVGDTCHDHEVAAALGIDCVLVAQGHHPARRLNACGVPVVADLRELARVLELRLPAADRPAATAG